MVAVAVGLGSVDMPVPSIAEWEWLNWKFPRAVHAGDTVYARWTLTQKRPPVGGSPSSIVVWRVDVHTADGTLCAEGEIGAKVRRGAIAPAARQPAATGATPTRRRRRRSRSNGSTAPEPAAPPAQAPPAPPKPAERASGQSRRRRRRRSGGAGGREENHEPSPAEPPITAVEPAAAQSPTASSRGISGVLRRLRGS